MIQLKIKDYSKEQKAILTNVLFDGMEITCKRIREEDDLTPISNCPNCKAYVICRDIMNAINYLQ